MSAYNTNNYTLGMAELVFIEDVSAAYDFTDTRLWQIGNIVVASIAPEITFLDHYTTTNGSRKKDRSLITNKALAVNFTFDEITAGAMKEWLLASAKGGSMTGATMELYPMARGEIKGCARLTFNSEFGRDYTWYIPCASFKPDGTFDYNSEDWMNAKGIIECTVNEAGDANKPFGKIEMDESSTYENYA